MKLINGLSYRLLFWIMLFSFFFTLASTGAQLYFDYSTDRKDLDHSLNQIIESDLPSLTLAVWTFNESQLTAILQGIIKQRDISYVEVSGAGELNAQLGNPNVDLKIERIYPLNFQDEDKVINIGTLRVVATLDEIIAQIYDKALLILVSQGIKIFAMSLCILFLINGLIVRHLRAMGQWADSMDITKLDQPLVIARNQGKKPDDIDHVVDSINQMRVSINHRINEISSIFEALPDLYFRINKEGVILDYHASRHYMTELPTEYFLNKKIQEVMPKEYHSITAEKIQHQNKSVNLSDNPNEVAQDNALNDIQCWEYKMHIGGTEKFFEARLMNLPESDNLILIARDITEQKVAAQALKDSEDVLIHAQRLDSLGKLTGGIAHDFNNMLSIILGFTGLALHHCDQEDQTMADYLEQVEITGKRAQELIAQMLIFSRGDKSNDKPLQLQSRLRIDLTMLRAVIPTSIKINTDFEENLPRVLMDPVQLDQLLMNLCINARDAMEGEGNITIKLSRFEAKQGQCTACRKQIDGDWVELSVADSGSGISQDVLDQVFDPYYTTKDVGKGTGMGMAVVHGIMHNHGGHILVETEPGKGSTFRLLFPAITGQVEDDHEVDQPLAETPMGNGERILVVDDEPLLSRFLKNLLATHGYEVQALTSSKQALDLFKEKPDEFALVITDQTMPGMTGMELIEAIRNIHPNIPVILNSGFNDNIDTKTITEMGIQYLDKPFSIPSMLHAIRKLL